MMRSNIVIATAAACLALTACAEAEEPVVEEITEEETVTEVDDSMLAADGQPAPGTYEITREDGTVITETVNADGTYNWTSSTGETGSGTWRTDGPNVWCTTEPGEEESCNDEMVDDAGVWTSVDREDGSTATVVRVDPTA